MKPIPAQSPLFWFRPDLWGASGQRLGNRNAAEGEWREPELRFARRADGAAQEGPNRLSRVGLGKTKQSQEPGLACRSLRRPRNTNSVLISAVTITGAT